MSGSDANAELMTRDSCPPIWLFIMPMPATSAAASAPMPRNLMKFPGAKNLVTRLPMVSRPDWSLLPCGADGVLQWSADGVAESAEDVAERGFEWCGEAGDFAGDGAGFAADFGARAGEGSPSRVMASRMVLLNSGFVLLPMAVMALPSGEVLIFPAAVARPLVMASPICPVLVLMPVAVLVRPV
ncbi:MAG: hypothetical protein ACLUAM_09660 [Bifidobacterium adolescentis]